MTPAEVMIARIRDAGIDLFIVPRPGPVEGVAQALPDGARAITVFGMGRGLDLARVLAHEWGHHVLHHATWSSTPIWRKELEAEVFAVAKLAPLIGLDDLELLVARCKAYLAPIVQHYLDAGITYHGELYVGRWLRCAIPDFCEDDWVPVLEDDLAAPVSPKSWSAPAPDDAEIPF